MKAKADGSSRAEKSLFGEVVVKKGYSWSEQVGIAVAALVDSGKRGLVNWTLEASAFLSFHSFTITSFCPFLGSFTCGGRVVHDVSGWTLQR